ncbi:Hypothetical Protein FCC1311_071812 [Hondaea fermentalgiana]|uniref:Uncharacterized protein n=1 Tax=Hondaea fermentalgiana TaxID=2315210 RepID=A0A2R5GJ98_9STRA|nr:Hypothetical Protein FCC1311_071812 [Hondaea fermentalgiana]|eukprot:GBG30960.1 Hypothetical Protein FCC1311_071812 [Hondaea fermentalgiana]
MLTAEPVAVVPVLDGSSDDINERVAGPEEPSLCRVDEEQQKESEPRALAAEDARPKATLLVNRLYLTALAVSLLWISSLPMAQFIMNRVLPSATSNDKVSESITQALTFVQSEAEKYSLCMSTRETRCTSAISRASASEEGRVAGIQIENEASLAQWSLDSDSCKAERQDALLLLSNLQANGDFFLQDVRTNSSDARCAGIDALIAQESAKQASLELASSFQAEADSLVAELAETMQARASYDAQYLTSKREAAAAYADTAKSNFAGQLETLEALRNESLQLSHCLRGEYDETTSTSCANVATKLEKIPKMAASSYAQAIQAYDELETRVDSMQTTLQSFQDAYDTFVNGLALRIVSWVLDPPSLNVQEIVTNALLDRVLPESTMQEFQTKLDAAEKSLEASLSKLANASSASVVAITDAQTQSATQESDEQDTLLRQLLVDYVPPETATLERAQAAVEAYTALEADFTESLEDIVDELGSASTSLQNTSVSVAGLDTIDSLLGTTTTNDVISSFETGSWDVFLYSGMQFQDFVDGWDKVSDLALLFDVIFRCFTTLQVVHRYMRISRVVTPPVDMREHNAGRPLGRPPQQTPLQRVAALALHPAAGALVLAGFAWAVAATAAALYMPLFERFVEGCVRADSADPGTFLTQNAATFASQFATREGASVAAGAIDRLNEFSSLTCASNLVSSQQVLVNQSQNAELLIAAATEAAGDLEAILECIDLDAAAFSKSSIASLVRLTSCKMNAGAAISEWAIRLDGTYDCEVLEPCAFDCTLPNDDLLAYWTWKAGCEGEGSLHHLVLQCDGFVAVSVIAKLELQHQHQHQQLQREVYLQNCERLRPSMRVSLDVNFNL